MPNNPEPIAPRVLAALTAAGATLVMLPFLGKPPVVDEESYLWLGEQVGLGRPYDWTRLWPPWTGDAYIFAHPPLFLWWMGLWRSLDLPLWATRLAAGLPFLLLFSAAAGWLAARTSRHSALAAGLWLASPILVLGLHNTLMIDLPAVALGTLAVAAWREGYSVSTHRTVYFLISGLALGLGIATKYPVALLAPVLAWHALRWRKVEERRPGTGPSPTDPWMALSVAVLVVLLVEGGLYATYGRWHLWEVWSRRGEIPSGSFMGRTLGVLVRAGLLCLPLALLRSSPALLAGGFGLALAMLALAHPPLAGMASGLQLVLLAGFGGSLLLRGFQGMFTSLSRRRKGDRGDGILLGGWLVVTLLGVVLFHNFASARYLLPAALPAALLVTRSAEEVEGGKGLQRLAILVAAILSLALAVADLRFGRAGQEVASDLIEKTRREGKAPGLFEGEWSFRWKLESAGWRHRKPGEKVPTGTLLAVAENSGSDKGDLDELSPIWLLESGDAFPLKVVDVQGGIGLYAETLGTMPVGWNHRPLETVTVYEGR